MKKLLILITFCFGVQTALNAQQTKDSIRTALLIVDIQEFYFPSEDRPGLENVEEASLKAKEVLHVFRENDALVVHVRHKSSQGFEIHENVKPTAGEKIITKQEVNSFLGTDLLSYLQDNRINRLVIIGMQTNMCLEAAVRAAHDYGFECIVIQGACAARDLKFGNRIVKAADVHATALATIVGGGYAKVIKLETFKEKANMYLKEKLY
jgi:nicotinamidase-related amidase